MPDKEQLENELRDVLGADVEYSRMTKDDMEQLLEHCESGAAIESLIKYKGKEVGEDKLDEMIDEWTPGQFVIRRLI